MKTRSHQFIALVVAMLLEIAGSMATAADAPDKTAEHAAAKQQKKLSASHGRLPAHFRSVVTEEQRQQIYAIQQQYGPEIRKLREQLKALTDERDAKINALLSPEQRKAIANLKEAAKEKRRKAKEKAR